jgi:hypothetical protein
VPVEEPVAEPLSSAKDITAFAFEGQSAADIDPVNRTITVTVPASADLQTLAPSISVSTGAQVNPASAVPRNFSTALTYTLTAEDGSTAEWTVTVTREPIRSAGEIGAYIDNLVTRGAYAGTQTNPVPLPLAFDLGKGSWASLLDAIAAAGKFVALDLSACAITDMSATAGEFDPDNTKATGKDKIVSLVLPDAATRIKGGGTFNDPTFKGFSTLTRFSAGSIVSIGDYAFFRCSSLTTINLPAGLASIGYGAFSGCTSLTTVSLPEGLTSIGRFAFDGCSKLASISLPTSLTSIGDVAFQNCSSLTSITLPAGLTSIGNGAFQNCSSLTTISLPASLTSIGSAFTGCWNLSAIQVDQANRVYVERDGVLFTKDFTKLITYPAKKPGSTYAVPERVTSIGDSAFQSCSGLTTITLPAGLTTIGERTFSGCSSLTSISLPAGLSSIGYMAFYDCRSLTTITLPASLTSIGNYAFSDCSSLTTITLPASLTSIGNYVFDECISLGSITLASPQPPRLNNGLWSSWSQVPALIYVPAASLDTYKNANGWKNHADRIRAAEN